MGGSRLDLENVPKRKRWVFIRNRLAIRVAKRHWRDLKALALE